MDPLSQAVTGAALAGCFSKNKTIRPALLLGAFAGMAPDLDVFFRSATDPLMALEYHRHFTHSLAFSPIGGLIVAAFFWMLPWIRNRLSFKQAWFFSFLGVFTHGLLDSCTGYGTHLLWPFTQARESWNNIGIIDLAYTLPVLALIIMASVRRKANDAYAAMIWMLAYLAFGFWQQNRAHIVAANWLADNQISHERLTIRPTISNLWLWRVLYKDNATSRWQAHALYVPYWSNEASIIKGESATIYTNDTPAGTQTHTDIERFNFFSDGYLSKHVRFDGSWWIGDARYGLTPDSAQPLWGIEITDSYDNHVIRHRSMRKNMNWDKAASQLKGLGFTPIN